MNRVVCFFVLFFLFSALNAQKLDLIVTKNNDSIACRIDSISTELIYFKVKRNTVYTGQIRQDEVTSFEKKAITRRKIRYLKDAIYFHSKSYIRYRSRVDKKK